MKRIVEYVSAVILGLAMVLGLGVLLGPNFGWQTDKVLSGSMSPAVKVGGAVVTQEVDPATIQAGDIITYRSPDNGRLTTHRVVEVLSQDPPRFQTKGDANENADQYVVSTEHFVGKVRLSVPYIGYPAQFAKTVWGFLVMIAIPGLIIIALEIRDVWVELGRQEKEKRKKMREKRALATATVEVQGEG